MQPDEKKHWFPAKRYGWGWRLPCRGAACKIVLPAPGRCRVEGVPAKGEPEGNRK